MESSPFPESTPPSRPTSGSPSVSTGAQAPSAEPGAGAHRFLISIDDAGQFLVLPSAAVVLGHQRNSEVDLPLLADVEALHARLERRTSFRGGVAWWLLPLADGVFCNAEPLERPRSLRSGDRLQLGNVGLDFRMPDAASESALLELREGMECAGAERVLLMAEGEAGRIRIGTAKHGHVRVHELEREIVLVLRGEVLEIHVTVIGEDGSSREDVFPLAVPPTAWAHRSFKRSTPGRPPFSLGVGPVSIPYEARGDSAGPRGAQ